MKLLLLLLFTRAVSTASQSCISNNDCVVNEYCAGGTCLSTGSCGKRLDCFNRANEYAADDCVGYIDCENGSCVGVCSSFLCPDETNPVKCFARPCDVTACDIESSYCLDDYCGGCNAVFLDDTGNQVCMDQSPLKKCESIADCLENDEYCGGGVCREAGTCSTRLDCFNPSNLFNTIKCAGYLECDNGSCIQVCSNSECPKGGYLAPCAAEPCAVTDCDEEYDYCLNEYCDGCFAHFVNAAGTEVCTGEDSLAKKCTSTADCQENEEYCLQGSCSIMGSCETRLDCFNPSNLYVTMKCAGYLDCEKGSCVQICSSSECPNGGYLTPCAAEPCAVTNCGEEYDYCLNEYCDGCDAHFVNAAGSEVCSDGENPLPTKCTSSSDCLGENKYCASGYCLPMGACNTIRDCQNKYNEYAVDACEGYLDCNEEGYCTQVCSSFACPDEIEPVECLIDPCKPADCNESFEYCFGDYCGCNAVFMSASGSEVCTGKMATIRPCTSGEDCNIKSEYCAAGVCRAHKTCENDQDCLNPKNLFDILVDCVGYKACNQDGKCEFVCSTSSCPEGNTVECKAAPCTVTKCGEGPVASCVNDYCGGCNALFFNTSGHEVCISPAPPTNEPVTNSDPSKQDEGSCESNCLGSIIARAICSVRQMMCRIRSIFNSGETGLLLGY